MSSSSSSSSSSSAKSDSSLSHNSHLPTEQQKLLKEIKKGGTQQRKLKRASDMLKGDKKFMLAAVRMNEKSLRFLSEELKHDFDFMLAAVKVKGMALEWGSTTMRTSDHPPQSQHDFDFSASAHTRERSGGSCNHVSAPERMPSSAPIRL